MNAKRSRRTRDEQLSKKKARPVDRHRIIHIAVEGESTEPDYLAALQREVDRRGIYLHVLAEPNGMKPCEVVSALEEIDGSAERWAIFDRDQHNGIPKAFALAKELNINVVFSHPSFDLWLLLHFQHFSGEQGGSSAVVREKLRRTPGFETFDIRNDKSLKGVRVAALRGKERDAAKRAKKLLKECPSGVCSVPEHAGQCDPLKRDPSTDVWKLLAALEIIDD